MKRRRSRIARAADVVIGTAAHYIALTSVFVGAVAIVTKNVAVGRLRRDSQ